MTELEKLFDSKLYFEIAPIKKTLRCWTDLIPTPALIIDDTEEVVCGNDPEEYLVVEDFVERSPSWIEREYLPVYSRLSTI